MTPNEVARKFARKFPGYKLIDFIQVALPVFVLRLEAIVIADKHIPIVDEFILRCIHAGIDTRADVAGFLGLEDRFLTGRLAALVGTDHVHYERSDTPKEAPRIKLTRHGEEAVVSAQLIQPRREKIEIAIDGITRKPVVRSDAALLRGYNVRAFGLQSIRPFPNRSPNLEEIGLPDLRYVSTVARKPEHNIVQILEVTKINDKMRLYREATMLVYKCETSDDLQVWFTIDGRRAEDIDEAFAAVDGLKALRISDQVSASRAETLNAIYELDLEDIRKRADSGHNVVREVVLPASEKLDKLTQEEIKRERALESSEDLLDPDVLRAELDKIKAEKQQLEDTIAGIEVRHLEVHEHRPLFEKALVDAKRRLLVVSPWINDHVMTQTRLNKIEDLLRNGVNVYIGYGIGDENDDKRPKDEGKNAINRLNKMLTQYPNLTFQRLGDTHAKILLVDDQFAVFGSFNWMSFEGNSRRSFREEISYYVAIKPKIEEFFRSYLGRFGIKAPTS